MTTSAEILRPGALAACPVAALPAFPAPPVRGLLRLPGVYRPQADTCLLAAAIGRMPLPAGTRALDLCAGTGVLAIALARQGAGSVLAVDLSRRALASTGFNALTRRLPVRLRRGGLATALAGGPYDVVVANPPYVPSPGDPSRTTRSFDAGVDGRRMLDPLCRSARELLAPGGRLLLVHSTMSGVDTSLAMLAAQGLRASVVRRARVPFGPVLNGRIPFLVGEGLIEPGQRLEELVVIRAHR